jgi:hypothetical protein
VGLGDIWDWVASATVVFCWFPNSDSPKMSQLSFFPPFSEPVANVGCNVGLRGEKPRSRRNQAGGGDAGTYTVGVVVDGDRLCFMGYCRYLDGARNEVRDS